MQTANVHAYTLQMETHTHTKTHTYAYAHTHTYAHTLMQMYPMYIHIHDIATEAHTYDGPPGTEFILGLTDTIIISHIHT